MDYYEILGVPRGASPEDIKKAYRKLSKEHHPDRSRGAKASEEKYKEINRAYEVLSDEKKKQTYDQFGSEDGPQSGGARSPFGQGFGGFEGAPFGGGGFGDIFETFFGGGGARGRGGGDVQGSDAETEVTISLREAFTGMRKTLRLRKLVTCEVCGGSGAAAGAKKVVCSTCKGTGEVTRTAQSFFGVIRQSVMCETCKGSGKVPEVACRHCRGEGRVQGTEEVAVDIPAGISDGQTLRLRGKGEAGRQGVIAGDLFVHIRAQGDARFTREGDDLRTSVRIPVADAVLGIEVQVETFSEPLTVKIPAGTQPGQVFRVKGQGMPVLSSSRRGDLYVTVHIEIPSKVGRRERELWEQLKGE